jgi:hypothetical protein
MTTIDVDQQYNFHFCKNNLSFTFLSLLHYIQYEHDFTHFGLGRPRVLVLPVP